MCANLIVMFTSLNWVCLVNCSNIWYSVSRIQPAISGRIVRTIMPLIEFRVVSWNLFFIKFILISLACKESGEARTKYSYFIWILTIRCVGKDFIPWGFGVRPKNYYTKLNTKHRKINSIIIAFIILVGRNTEIFVCTVLGSEGLRGAVQKKSYILSGHVR